MNRPLSTPPTGLHGRWTRPTARGSRALFCVALLLAGAPLAARGETLVEPRLMVWGFSEGASFQQPRGIAFDPSDGAIYVANTGEHRIEIFSKTGRPLSRFVHRITRRDGVVTDGNPSALAFDRAGQLLVVDMAAPYVDVIDRRGRAIARMEVPTGRPSAVAVAPNGDIFVGTTGDSSRVHRFRPDYTLDATWGEDGGKPGQLFWVSAIGVLPDGTVAVACKRTTLGIQIFTRDGAYVRGFATHELGRGCISLPSGLVGTADGRIWVLDEIRQTLQVYDKEGVFITQTGGRGIDPGEFAHPSALSFDGKGLLAVTDGELGRFQVLGIPQP